MVSIGVLVLPLLFVADTAPTSTDGVQYDMSRCVIAYGGDFRIQRTRAEIVFDVSPSLPDIQSPEVRSTRLVLTPYTAKRFRYALQMSIDRHESAFGPIVSRKQPSEKPVAAISREVETDVVYANFCRTTGTPEELIFDFGLSRDLDPDGRRSVLVQRTLVFTFPGGKSLLTQLAKVLDEYEAEVGVIEMNPQKRLKQQ